MIVDVIIPAFNEEKSIGKVIADIPKQLIRTVIVANNNSSDNTAKVAQEAGAILVNASKQGYGAACLAGMSVVKQQAIQPDVVIFIDGDYSDYPEEMALLLTPIKERNIDMVIGSRALGKREHGAMLPQQLFGNWLATNLIRLLFKHKYTDLGPFRAVKWDVLQALSMRDETYGWTVEMQLKVLKQQFSVCEIPVNYKKRIGTSKIAGTLKGTLLAGYKIIATILKYS